MLPACREAELLFLLLSLTVARDVLALSCSFATDSVDFVLHDRELPGRVFGGLHIHIDWRWKISRGERVWQGETGCWSLTTPYNKVVT